MGERAGRRILASGAFELLHPGHIRFLAEAKRVGGEASRLIVVVARDETIRKRKGREPLLGEEARREIVSMLKPVDEAILGHTPFSFERIIEEVKPDIVVFGYDQDDLMREFLRFIESKGLSIEVVKLGKFTSREPSSTSELIKRAAEILGKSSSR
ncbi:MAG: adenylyltransferase/cytidyltransferase family protein [Nitrososphaerota archaeon]